MQTTLFSKFVRRYIRRGNLTIRFPDGHLARFGDGHGRALRFHLTSRRAMCRLALYPDLALGELFMEDRLRMEQGRIHDLLELIFTNVRTDQLTGMQQLTRRASALRARLGRVNTPLRARRNVAHHYDLNDDLYRLFLEEDRQYSCAYFEHPAATLEEAQLAKKRHVAAKLHLPPAPDYAETETVLNGSPAQGQANGAARNGHAAPGTVRTSPARSNGHAPPRPAPSVLDIGSGWGGLGLYLARHYGADVTGVTLSREQHRVSNDRARRAGLDGRVRFEMQDYRSLARRFDRIVSVGMFEHVGRAHIDTFFACIADLLAPDGVMLLHYIGQSGPPAPTSAWVRKYIFPGGDMPALSEVLPAIERHGLIVTDIEVLRLHYAETLRHWRERFLARRQEAVALYDERFARMWEFYLAAAETSFRHQRLVVHQIQLARRLDALPVTRDYITAEEARLRPRDGGGDSPLPAPHSVTDPARSAAGADPSRPH